MSCFQVLSSVRPAKLSAAAAEAADVYSIKRGNDQTAAMIKQASHFVQFLIAVHRTGICKTSSSEATDGHWACLGRWQSAF